MQQPRKGRHGRERSGDLQRMMDVTRATLYFAKGALLVEGISEAMLIPALAKRLGYNLAKLHISVIPICGVAFEHVQEVVRPATPRNSGCDCDGRRSASYSAARHGMRIRQWRKALRSNCLIAPRN